MAAGHGIGVPTSTSVATASRTDGAFESTVAQRTDGSLLMILRTPRDFLWRAESRDRGLTWTKPEPTDIKASNSPAFLLSL
jgi:predicted neuraminidase